MTEIGNSEEMITEQLEVPVDVQMESSVDSAPEPEQVESSAEDRENLKRKRDSTLALELGEDDEDESTDDTYEEEETASESAATEEMDSAATEQNDGEVQEGVPKLAGMPENVQLEEILNNSISDAASVSGLVYDARLLAHAPLKKEDFDHPENPERIRKIYEALKDSGCLYKFKRIQVKQAREDQIVQFHSKEHFMEMMATSEFDTETLILKAQEFNSIYLNAQSSYCALLSCGGVISLVDAVWNGEVKNGFAIVRPPGHHAEPEEPMGFCLFNNVAIAALHLKKEYKAKRIAIIDWDVHHGNGTQTAFYEDKEVLFISLHRYDNGKFYPSFKNADYTYVGNGDAVGMNINIPWPSGGFGDQDYIYAFQKVILPVLAEFEPEIILVSCGFDAALNDPIGACSVTPQGYEHMTYMLGQFANGKLVLALEGGYHLESVARSAVSCARVLLGNSPRELPKNENGISLECVKIVDKVISTLSPFWRCFGRYHISPDMLRNSFIPDRASKEDLQLHSTINSMSLVPVKDIVRAYRNLRLRQVYSMSPITQLFGPETESFADVNVTSDIFTAKTSILFVHDSPCIRTSTSIENLLDLNNSIMVDETLPYIDSFLAKRWGLIDVNLRAQDKGYFPDRYNKLKLYNLREETQDKGRLEKLLGEIYDRYVKSFQGKFFLIFMSGYASSAVQKLLMKNGIEKEVQSLVLILPPNASPPIMTNVDNQEKLDWFMEKSVILMPDEAIPWSIVELPRCGVIWSTGEANEKNLESVQPSAILRRYFAQISTILDGRWWW